MSEKLRKEELLEWLLEAWEVWRDAGYSGCDRDMGRQAHEQIMGLIKEKDKPKK